MRPLKVQHIDIGKEFASHLSVRFRADGDKSGQEFRENLLEPACLENDKVVVNLDGIDHYTVAWMDEAFGGISRKHGLEFAAKKIYFMANQKPYLVRAFSMISKPLPPPLS